MQYGNTKLTFAGPNALGPRVIKARVSGTSACIDPSTAAGTTAEFTGLLDRAALGAYTTDR